MLDILSKNPIIGFISGVGASFLQYLNDLEPFVKAFGFLAGIVIAILTIYAKILEIKKYSRSKK